MTRRASTIIQRVWDPKARTFKHRLIRAFRKTRIGAKPKLSEAEKLFVRA